VGLEGRKPTQIAGRWLSVGRAVLWDFTYLCWNLTTFYNRRRTHSSLGPGIPEPVEACVPTQGNRHHLPAGYRIAKTAVLGGLHHEYRLEKVAA
jgi:hypothetical protein